MKTVLVGITPDGEKFGNKILHHLLLLGDDVIGINPKYSQVEGVVCFKTISDIGNDFDRIVFVVNPTLVFEIIHTHISLLHDKILWFQPGSYDQKVLDFCQNNHLNYEAKNCILKS